MNREERRAITRQTLPPRRVYSDDLEISIERPEGGIETYHPRAGEYVQFHGSVSVGLLIATGTLAELSEGLEQGAQFSEFKNALEAVVDGVLPLIKDWTWADHDGNPLPSPPERATLLTLSIEELLYLMAAATGGASEELRKNGSSPSMPTSKASRARGRPRGG